MGDAQCQRAMLELSRDWKGMNPGAQAVIAPFHPVSTEEIKQANDIDVYFLQSLAGSLNRVHFVKENGIGRINPPPDNWRCEACQTKGWLRKEFVDSKVDGANAPMWLCPRCANPNPMPTESESSGGNSSPRPKTGLQQLDENPGLLDLMEYVLALAVKEVARTGSQMPLAVFETQHKDKFIQGFTNARLELAYEEARSALLAAPPQAERYGLAWAGYLTVEGVRYEAILVGGGERGEANGAAIGMRYKQRLPDIRYEPIGNAKILGPKENLLTLSADPEAASKLRPVVARLTADMAHKHGPGQDEALNYELRKCQEVILDFGDIDRPFMKELQKKPDVVHVVMGRRSWLTKFGPEDKEVILARDTLVPFAGGQPFPGFVEDGLITLGYFPPEGKLGAEPDRLDLFVLWMTQFKITDKEIRG